MKGEKLIWAFIKIAILASLICLFIASYNYYDNYRLGKALQKANKVPDILWDAQYKSANVKNKYKVILVLSSKNDLNYGEYFKYSAERLGWDAKIIEQDTLTHLNEIMAFDPDFMIFADDANPKWNSLISAHRSKKYLLSFTSFKQLKELGQLSFNPYLASGRIGEFNKITHGVLTSSEVDMYRTMYALQNKIFFGLKLLPIVSRFDNEPANPSRLIWVENNPNPSKDHRAFIKKLSENISMKAYGHYNSLLYLDRAIYGGYVTPGPENINAIRNNGIYLFHSNNQAISINLFEAAAANVVIIADRHPFIVENFADNILYYDATAKPQTMYQQVKEHLDWIKQNPAQAKLKASAVHKIFLERFCLEKDLIRIARMHEACLAQDKLDWKLDYPLGY